MMIMGIANFFTPEMLSWHSILYFIMMVTMFLFYFGEFDHAINEESDTKGLFLIYSHYPIFVGLIMTTVSMNFLVDPEANHHFVVWFLYIGLALFQWAVLANGKHNKKHLRYSKSYLAIEAVILLAGLALSLMFVDNLTTVVVITTVMLFAMETHFTHFYITQTSKHHKVDWYWV